MGQHGARPWLMLALGVAAQATSTVFIYGVPFLVPALSRSDGLSLVQSGVLIAAPTVGLVLTLIAWGAAADRWGERLVMSLGLGLAGLALLLAVASRDIVELDVSLAVAGAFGGSVNAASGRLVMGWFSRERRGLAMGIRQTGQPLGVAVASLTLPHLAEGGGAHAALLLPAILSILVAAAVAIWAVDPPVARTTTSAALSPYRTPILWRVHGASALLVVPQLALNAFAFLYLVTALHWPIAVAGPLMAGVQALGACGRLVAGAWSDRVGDRLRPMRVIALITTVAVLLVALGDARHSWLVVIPLIIGGITSVSPNGLGFTATAELAGPAWTGRALGVQNTAQNILGAFTPPVLGAIIGGSSYGVAFAVCALFPALAILVTPVARRQLAISRKPS